MTFLARVRGRTGPVTQRWKDLSHNFGDQRLEQNGKQNAEKKEVHQQNLKGIGVDYWEVKQNIK